MKSVVQGVAGSVRLVHLTMAGLKRAEDHGKRLDATGKARAINDTPAETTTGLGLKDLYTRHVDGAFIPQAKTKAMHMILQFPKELVDENDSAGMLYHARVYAARVFGPDAVFGDRIDRDEKNKQVVDLFLAPRYLKQTKRAEKVAISMTRHLKLLATKHGHPPIPQGIGRALQDELYEYFRDAMKLPGVQRGAKKAFAGPDWKSAEQQRLEELEGIERALELERAAVEEKAARLTEEIEELNAGTAALNKREGAVKADEDRLAERESNVAGREADVEVRDNEVKDKEDAAEAREASLDQRTEEIDACMGKTADALAAAETARAAADRARAEMEAAFLAAVRDRDAAATEAEEAEKMRADASAGHARATAVLDAAAAERTRVEAERATHEAQLALLARAADDDAGLRLRTTEKSFSMNQSAMTSDERETYCRVWSSSLIRIARQLAWALDQVRARAHQLLGREKRIEEREAAAAAKEQTAERELASRRDTQRREHKAAMADLDRRSTALRADEEKAAILLAEAEEKMTAATDSQTSAEAKEAAAAEKQARADAIVLRNLRWSLALNSIDCNPDWVELIETNTVQLAPGIPAPAAPTIVAVAGEQPPSWALAAVTHCLDLAESKKLTAKHEKNAAYAAERLSEMLACAGPLLTSAQQQMAAEAKRELQQFNPAHRAAARGMEM